MAGKDKRTKPGTQADTIDRVNAVTISADELWEFISECEKLDGDVRRLEGHSFTAARLHPGNSDKARALMFRAEALARILHEGGGKNWALPGPDGIFFAERAVVAAAAVEPLIVRGRRIVFRKRSFIKTVLELSEMESGLVN